MSREFQIFAKPGGAVCNLDCRYCYYLDRRSLYPGVRSFKMDDGLLERYVVQQIEIAPGELIRFSWHGGEPTTLGLDYFRKIVALQKKHAPNGKQIVNGLVTNGTLLDEEWCQFLSAEHFAVGLSLDGPASLHDEYRVSKGGRPTHADALRGYELLRRYQVPCDILCVVHDRNVDFPEATYGFFKEIGATFVGFLPLVARPKGSGEGAGERSVPPVAYGSFLCTIFDGWICDDIGRILIQNFDEAARPIRGLEHALCIFRETCGDIPALEHNGDLYSCDHFVVAEHLLGNIRCQTLAELLRGPVHTRFGLKKRDSLTRYCLECEVLPMCNGGCPKDRFIAAPDGEFGLNYLCAGLKMFFTHCRPIFEKLIPLWKSGAPAAQLMVEARGGLATTRVGVGRNDPCPCGSGKKFKKCCFERPTRNIQYSS